MTVIRGERIYRRDPRNVNSPVVPEDSSDPMFVDMPGVSRDPRNQDMPT